MDRAAIPKTASEQVKDLVATLAHVSQTLVHKDKECSAAHVFPKRLADQATKRPSAYSPSNLKSPGRGEVGDFWGLSGSEP